MSRRLSARFPTPIVGRAPALVGRSRRSGAALDGLREIERWLVRTGPEVDALVAGLAPRCHGGGRADLAIGASSETRCEPPALSFEQELRITAVMQDLSAALTATARLAAAALVALGVREEGDTDGR